MANYKKEFKRKQGSGGVWIWLTALSTTFGLIMIAGLLLLIFINGFGIFWPSNLQQFNLKNGEVYLGEVWEKDAVNSDSKTEEAQRLRLKIANRDIYGLDFKWIDESDIESTTEPDSALFLERMAWGQFYGFAQKLTFNDATVASGAVQIKAVLSTYLSEVNLVLDQIHHIEKVEIEDISYKTHALQLQQKRLQIKADLSAAEELHLAKLSGDLDELQTQFAETESRLITLREEVDQYKLEMLAASGESRIVRLADVVRWFQPNEMNVFEKTGIYLARLWEFLSDSPREANMEGGVLPAIFGTVMMVFIMSLAVVPLGVLAAIYLHEYAKQGIFVRLLRIAVNNLAGVPSIVYGIFGLGFFVYIIGGSIDQLFFSESLPNPTYGTGGILWASLTLALLTVPVVIVTAEEGLAAVPSSVREGSLALGATKFETLWRVILPSASPSIFTGLILAVARAAGEVAPLMVTGVVKLAPSLPIDGYFPYIHLERKFMHLGFHIYDVGFQSPNVEAALPMVYATTLLLIFIVVTLNLSAVFLRKRLQQRFAVTNL
ncbi:MAG: phosphate ABC transporter permease PtsA [Calditrichaeota bacterium]|nr:MAG: phosphate ABC transporter permease PtsA [Calditrichota bacterium]